MTLIDMTTDRPLDVVWASPETGLWVASILGDYAGMIEFAEGHFVVSDAAGRVIASAPSIPEAKAALAAAPAPRVAHAPFGPLSALAHVGRTARPGYRRSSERVA